MGPLPQLDRMTFEVVQTYSDGTVVRWADPAGGGHPAPTLALVPPAPGAATGHGHGGAADGTDAGADPAVGAEPTEDGGDGGPSADLLLGGGLLVGLGGGAAIGWVANRSRRRSAAGDADAADENTGRDDDPTPATDSTPDDRAWRFDGHSPTDRNPAAPGTTGQTGTPTAAEADVDTARTTTAGTEARADAR